MAGEVITLARPDLYRSPSKREPDSEAALLFLEEARDRIEVRGWKQIPDLILQQGYNDPLIQQLQRSENPFAQAVSLATFTANNLPTEIGIKTEIALMPEVDATPTIAASNWRLCHRSEGLMINGVQDGGIVKVGGLMVKFNGLVTALCYESFATQTGTFIRGNFYSPDRFTQERLRSLFIEGVAQPDLPDSQWDLMRAVNTGGEVALEMVSQMAKDMPDTLPERPGGEENRKEYLRIRSGDFNQVSIGVEY